MAARIVHGEHVCSWVAERTGGTYFGGGVAFGLERDGKPICAVLFEEYTGRAMKIHVAKEPDSPIDRQWLYALFGYAFNQVKVHKLIGPIDSAHADALNFARRIGFVDEAVIKDAAPIGDILLLTMTREQCRFLKDDNDAPTRHTRPSIGSLLPPPRRTDDPTI
jgi:hypothetical protein